jgi:hypothetical protein
MVRHIIHKQKVMLQVSKRENAGALQASVSNLLQHELRNGIDALFTEAFPADKIIRIDTLQLNLGVLNQQNFERDFKAQFLSELAKGLSAQKENLNFTGSAEELSNTQSLINAFIFFLEKGYLPWYQSATSMGDWETELLNNFTSHEYQRFFDRILVKHRNSEPVIQRLVLQFSDKFLEELMVRSEPGFVGPWELIYKDITLIVNNIIKPDAATIRQKIWEYTFHALPDKKGEELSLQVLKQMTVYFGIKARDISDKKRITLNKTLETAMIQCAFKELVLFLKLRDKHAAGDKNDPSEKNAGTTTANPATVDESAIENEEDSNIDGSPSSSKKTKPNSSQSKKDASVIGSDAIFVNNSGTVILHPFLKPYFEDLGLWADKKFVSDDAHQRAVLLLHYLATGETKVAEFNLALQKVMCGYPLDDTLPDSIILTKKEIAEAKNLLNAVISHWVPLKNTSIQGLRASFLQREGKLELRENGWLLTIEQKTLDILLGKLPWGISTIRLPWMKELLNVDWY